MATPTDALTFLALQMRSKPGMFAVLLGSGVSRAALMPTGWEVVQDLVRQIAVAGSRDVEKAMSNPEGWWQEHFGSTLGYSELLEQAAPTPAARASLISHYFEPTQEQRENGELQPTAAHTAIAELVRDGYVGVILTTNFDSLMEQALDAAGVGAQVITHSGMVEGMDSLHLRPTVLKLHGDYRSVSTLNTATELETYPEHWRDLLRQILTDYGLLISGWSAAWDGALRDCILATPTRRYPLYWDERSSSGAAAQRIVMHREAVIVPAADADAMFTALLEAVRNLERSESNAPLRAELAVAAAKRYLASPVRRIELAELLEAVSEPVRIVARTPNISEEPRLAAIAEASQSMLAVISTCVRFGEGWEVPLIVAAVRDLLAPDSPFGGPLPRLQSYGATLATYAIGLAERRFGDRGILLEVLRADSKRREGPTEQGFAIVAQVCLRKAVPLRNDELRTFARFSNSHWHMPAVEMVAGDLREFGCGLGFDLDDTYAIAFDDVEFRIALVNVTGGSTLQHAPSKASGRWMLQDSWTRDSDPDFSYRPRAEIRFRGAVALPDGQPWRDYLVDAEGEVEAAITKLHARAEAVREQFD